MENKPEMRKFSKKVKARQNGMRSSYVIIFEDLPPDQLEGWRARAKASPSRVTSPCIKGHEGKFCVYYQEYVKFYNWWR